MCLCNKCLCAETSMELQTQLLSCANACYLPGLNPAFTVFFYLWETNENTANPRGAVCLLRSAVYWHLQLGFPFMIYSCERINKQISITKYQIKNVYYETDHYFDHHCCPHNDFLLVLSFVITSKPALIENSCSSGKECYTFLFLIPECGGILVAMPPPGHWPTQLGMHNNDA